MNHTKKMVELSSVLQIMLILGIIGGFYNYSQGFMDKTIAILAKGWCSLFAVLQIIIYVLYFWKPEIQMSVIEILTLLLADQICHLVGSALSRERYLFKYLNTLKTIDVTMKWQTPRDTDFAVAMFSANILNYSTILICCASFHPSALMYPHLHMISLIHILLALGYFPKLVIFESLWKRMRLLHEWVEEQHSGDRTRVWRKSLHTYKNLLDNVTDANRTVKFIMLFEVLIVTLRMLHYSFYFTTLLLHLDSVLVKFQAALAIFQFICIVAFGFAPGILLELVDYEYEKLKARLADDILFKSDASSRGMLYDTKEYFEERPPRYSLWRVLPLNAGLLTGALSLCITYTIVLLQMKE